MHLELSGYSVKQITNPHLSLEDGGISCLSAAWKGEGAFGLSFALESLEGRGGASLVVLRASNARGSGLIPGPGTKIPHARGHGQKKKNKRKNEVIRLVNTLISVDYSQ